MCWTSMQINYTIKHWGWGDCCALPNSPRSREKKLSPVIHYQWVFCRENMEVCVPYLQWYYAGQQTYISEKIANKMTDIQAISINRDITPCMLCLLNPSNTAGHLLTQEPLPLCEGSSQHDSPLSCCYRPCCFLRKSVKPGEVRGSQREVLTGECEMPGVKRGCLSVCLINS